MTELVHFQGVLGFLVRLRPSNAWRACVHPALRAGSGFPIWALLAFGSDHPWVWEAVCVLQDIELHLWPLLIRCQQQTPGCDNQKCLQTRCTSPAHTLMH